MSEPSGTSASASPFRRRTAWAIALVGAVSFAVALVLTIFGDELGTASSVGADSFSRSAIGHRGLSRFVRELGAEVLVSRHDSGLKASIGLLMVVEPRTGDDRSSTELRAMIESAGDAIVVLPKWTGTPSVSKAGWLEDVALVPPDDPAAVLAALGIEGEVVRPAALAATRNDALAGAPVLRSPQLVSGASVEALVWNDDGVLIGRTEVGGTTTYLIADPDLVNNHGLGRGDNAALIAGVIALAHRSGGVVFDETLHGFRHEPSLWRVLFEPPLLLSSLQIAVVGLLLAWAAGGRFGPRLAEAHGLALGKAGLIENTASLMMLGGHGHHALTSYLAGAQHDVARRLHLSGRPPAEVRRVLDAVAHGRGAVDLATLEADVAGLGAARRPRPQRVTEIARRIHRWKEEMIDGTRRRPPGR